MKNNLLALIAAALLSGTTQRVDAAKIVGVDQDGGAIWEQVAKVSRLLKGRVMACFVQPGMSREQVERILGEDCLHPGFLIGATRTEWWVYYDYDVTVRFSNFGHDDALRVDEVKLLPLFTFLQR